MFPPGGFFQEEIFTFQSTPADSNMPAGNFQICLRPMPYRCKKRKKKLSHTPRSWGKKVKPKPQCLSGIGRRSQGSDHRVTRPAPPATPDLLLLRKYSQNIAGMNAEKETDGTAKIHPLQIST